MAQRHDELLDRWGAFDAALAGVAPARHRAHLSIGAGHISAADEDRGRASHPALGGSGLVLDLDLSDGHLDAGDYGGIAQALPRKGQVRAVPHIEKLDVDHGGYRKGSSALEGQAMLIGELAGRSGISAKTLRYYESIGVLGTPERTAAGYRDYDDDSLDRLAFIRSAQAAGFTLAEIRDVMALRDRGIAPCTHVAGLIDHKVAAVERQLTDLQTLHGELERLRARARALDPAACEPRTICDVLTGART